ncbi:hypothetical protein FRC04_003754 [Tulasnella sp. 424]|nr:hypothetical protein FRC04_003754 [Tulasnella sp. 424]KAG8977085.1 hypothetical protein FRC05_002606 [Tulasnella sp. 425]
MIKNRDISNLLQLLEEDEARRASSVLTPSKTTPTPQPRKSSILARLQHSTDDTDHEAVSEPSVESNSPLVQDASTPSASSFLEKPHEHHEVVHQGSTRLHVPFPYEQGESLAAQLRILMKGKKRLSVQALQQVSNELGKLEKEASTLEQKYLEDTGLAQAILSLSTLAGFNLPSRDKYKWVERAQVLSSQWIDKL